MATCKECLHYDICSSIEGLVMRVILARNKAEDRCKLFKPTADVVEVVRCGQCKCWKNKRKGVLGEYIGDCHNVDFPFHCEFRPVMRESDFCSYGERK